MELTQEQQDLVEKNINLVYAVAKRLNVLGNEDAIQEGIMGLCIASIRYNNKAFKFSTFATSYIRGYVLHFINSNRLIKPGRDGNKYVQAEVELLEDDAFLSEYNTSNINSAVELDCDLKRKLVGLDDSYKLLYQMLLEGMTQIKMAKVLNCSQSTVIFRIRKLRNYLEGVK